jgi:hypothetical protein
MTDDVLTIAYMAGVAAAGSQWRPISEAPKDDTHIDLWRGERKCRATNMRRVDLGGGNVFYEGVGSGPSCVRDATHWMPIPKPPADKTA